VMSWFATFASKFDLYHYTSELFKKSPLPPWARPIAAVGLCTLNQVDP
jgi:hypothetical protein